MADADAPPPKKPGGIYQILRPRDKRFVEGIVQGLRHSDAARRMGYKGPRADQAAWRMLQRPEIQAAIEDYDALMTQEAMQRRYRTIRQIEFIAHFDHRQLYGDDGELLPVTEWPDEVASVVASQEVEELFAGVGERRIHIGRLRKIKTWSKIEALGLLAKIQKLVVERKEITGKDGTPLAPPVFNFGFKNGGPGEPGSSSEGS